MATALPLNNSFPQQDNDQNCNTNTAQDEFMEHRKELKLLTRPPNSRDTGQLEHLGNVFLKA